jgi:hypothetical protein
MYNKSRGSTSGSGTRKTLNLKSNSRSLHPWQAFAKLFGSEMKDRVDNEWKEYKEANPEASHSHQARFKFHNKKMQEWYEEADLEKKKEVEEFRQKYKDDLLEGDDPNRLFQE